MKYSVLLPVVPVRPEQAVLFANIVQWTGAERLWQGQSLVLDSHHTAQWLAGIGIRVPTGFGVSLMPMRSPYQAAFEARSVALATGHSVVAGFGPGPEVFQKALLGRPYASPLLASREYVRIVRALVSGEDAMVDGEYFSVSARLVPRPAPPVSVGLGVLRPKMAALAGELADQAITWMCSADHLGESLIPAMRAADRKLEQPVRTTAIVPLALAREGRDVTALVEAACGSHLKAPHYQDALHKAGITVSGQGGGQDAARLLEAGVFQYGTVEQIHDRLEEFRAAGVDEVVLNTIGVAQVHGPKAAAQDLLEILGSATGVSAADIGLK
ncbi:LLM class flavin-dependent oxidoreductase [Streptomyces sp. TS71-3]|uniref:LLM class flavin-dependent oxidoreductase n=1 Tax=Streptomyces sp. TS71-3 TaxID=2733862 RepID=UPI001B2CFC3E|nr:LLM class flavin-dependent oxidoreductase [Streptomyces sp. TS71-3]GHJ36779.1 LLM class F420-dependent oxidoreductase [Streptomyces sp. TS71-3]